MKEENGGFEVVCSCTLQQAIEDGLLVEVFKNRWQQLSI
jgi:hypothetical protein